MNNSTNWPQISVAPMMDWTDRHCRYFMRLLSPSIGLYTEMITAAAIRHGDADNLLRFDKAEAPIAVQLGGSEPKLMAHAAEACQSHGYDEININVGCPSDRVQSGQFGACLMAQPQVVASCYKAMQQVSDLPITIKTRIGIDDNVSDEFLTRFVDSLTAVGCRKFIVHARIAILEGLSPKDNRKIPPLNYERVFRLKQEFPDIEIHLNGGVTKLTQVADLLERVDGVMIGRQAYHDPYFLAELENRLLGGASPPNRGDIVLRMLPYIERQLKSGQPLIRMSRHMLGLYAGQPGARAWRRSLSENAHRRGAGIDVLQQALDAVPEAA